MASCRPGFGPGFHLRCAQHTQHQAGWYSWCSSRLRDITVMSGFPGDPWKNRRSSKALPVFPCCVRACFICSKFLFLSFVLICARNKCQHQFVMKDRINSITCYHTPFKVPMRAECLASGAAVETNPTAKCGSQKLLMFRRSSKG